jgi:hypothetical protein
MYINIPYIVLIAALRVAAKCGTPDPTPEQSRIAMNLQARWTDPLRKVDMAPLPVNISINA